MDRRKKLQKILTDLGSVAVALSGGVDSSLLLGVASKIGSIRVVAVTGVSPSLSKRQLEQAKRTAVALDVRHHLIDTQELNDPRYVANPDNRCFFCKEELFKKMKKELGPDWPNLADGTNVDDESAHRPGDLAKQEAGVLSPLQMAGLGKEDIRAWARELGLETAETPASPCLASRIAPGVAVTFSALARVEKAEEEVRKLGIADFRVRDLDGEGRLEVSGEDLPRLQDATIRDAAIGLMRYAGFAQATVDDRPLKSGRLQSDSG